MIGHELGGNFEILLGMENWDLNEKIVEIGEFFA